MFCKVYVCLGSHVHLYTLNFFKKNTVAMNYPYVSIDILCIETVIVDTLANQLCTLLLFNIVVAPLII
jgi:hypothetical protein